MSDKLNESILWQKGYRLNSKGQWHKPTQIERDAHDAEHKPDPSHDALGESKGTDDYPGFRIVRITSHRVRLCDERNLFDKYFTDCLVKAGLLRDDSPQWCRIEVSQVQASRPEYECTEIEIIEPAAE